ncbi:hypothetical protein K435DRAFT_579369, partial [Dendrothele bispora CBS 962.96]
LPECQDNLISELSPVDRFRYSLACKQARAYVVSFEERAFRVGRVLRRYFPDSLVLRRFRRLQYRLNILISGSTALQFFNRSFYASADLDLYVNYSCVPEVRKFLETHAGYNWVPRSHEERVAHYRLYEASVVTPAYENRGIVGVFNFERKTERVQVIATRHGPMDAVLGFHSTCVMNVITFSHAYSLFPYTSFHYSANITIARRFCCARSLLTSSAAIQKYEDRGWASALVPSSDVYLMRCSEFRKGVRYVGDPSTWVVKLEEID